MTPYVRWAAVSTMRRALQDGLTPLLLQLNARERIGPPKGV